MAISFEINQLPVDHKRRNLFNLQQKSSHGCPKTLMTMATAASAAFPLAIRHLAYLYIILDQIQGHREHQFWPEPPSLTIFACHQPSHGSQMMVHIDKMSIPPIIMGVWPPMLHHPSHLLTHYQPHTSGLGWSLPDHNYCWDEIHGQYQKTSAPLHGWETHPYS